MITAEQLQALRGKVEKLVTDKGDADVKTQASNTADTAAAQANAAASQAKLDESAADALVATDLSELATFIDGLAAAPAAPVPPS